MYYAFYQVKNSKVLATYLQVDMCEKHWYVGLNFSYLGLP